MHLNTFFSIGPRAQSFSAIESVLGLIYHHPIRARAFFLPASPCARSLTTVQSLRVLFYAFMTMSVGALFFRYRVCECFHLRPFNPCDGLFQCAPCSNTIKSISAHIFHHRVCDRASFVTIQNTRALILRHRVNKLTSVFTIKKHALTIFPFASSFTRATFLGLKRSRSRFF